MNEATLLALAMEANESPAALAVLGDALLESGWTDRRVPSELYRGRGGDNAWTHISAPLVAWWFATNASTPTPTFARAVSAVLLFGGWSEEMWPVCERAVVQSIGFQVETATGSVLDRLAELHGLSRHRVADIQPDPTGADLAVIEPESDSDLRRRILRTWAFSPSHREAWSE